MNDYDRLKKMFEDAAVTGMRYAVSPGELSEHELQIADNIARAAMVDLINFLDLTFGISGDICEVCGEEV